MLFFSTISTAYLCVIQFGRMHGALAAYSIPRFSSSQDLALQKTSAPTPLRRKIFAFGISTLANSPGIWSLPLPTEARVSASQPPTSPINPLEDAIQAQETLEKLLDNWKRATIDCTYADVPRELLEQKNKQLLLEKASTFALFDKSVSVETCRKTNRLVRDYLGVTGKGPLVGIDKKLKRGLEFLNDADDFDKYVRELENFSQEYSRASSLSYAAGVADFDSLNNFSKEEADNGSSDDVNSNLNQSKVAIAQAKASLDVIVALLQKNIL